MGNRRTAITSSETGLGNADIIVYSGKPFVITAENWHWSYVNIGESFIIMKTKLHHISKEAFRPTVLLSYSCSGKNQTLLLEGSGVLHRECSGMLKSFRHAVM